MWHHTEISLLRIFTRVCCQIAKINHIRSRLGGWKIFEIATIAVKLKVIDICWTLLPSRYE
jgi:hypothetical protein